MTTNTPVNFLSSGINNLIEKIKNFYVNEQFDSYTKDSLFNVDNVTRILSNYDNQVMYQDNNYKILFFWNILKALQTMYDELLENKTSAEIQTIISIDNSPFDRYIMIGISTYNGQVQEIISYMISNNIINETESQEILRESIGIIIDPITNTVVINPINKKTDNIHDRTRYYLLVGSLITVTFFLFIR